jgi:hypothetical protein
MPLTRIKSLGITDGTITAADFGAGVGGKLLQVVSTNKSNTFSTTSTSFVDITDFSVSITPSSASNKILVIASLGIVSGSTLIQHFFRMVRNSTNILIPSSAGNRTLCNFGHFVGQFGDDNGYGQTYQILDSPNTTSSTTYKVQCATQDTYTLNINGVNNDSDIAGIPRGTSTITVMEIAG